MLSGEPDMPMLEGDLCEQGQTRGQLLETASCGTYQLRLQARQEPDAAKQ